MAKPPLILAVAAITVCGLVGTALTGSVAGANPVSSPVGPKQPFLGVVNGASESATVTVLCPGPVRLNQRGYAAPDQTVGIETPVATSAVFGFTGTKADSIVAQFVGPTTTAAAGLSVTFTEYGDQPIPTDVLLPCSGTATAVFSPRPTSRTARSTHVAIRFVSTCAATVCPLVKTDADRSA